MKTIIPFRLSMLTLMLSFMLMCCTQEDMLPRKNTISTEGIETRKTYSDLPESGESEKIQTVLPITKEMEEAVAEITKPARETMEKLLNENNSGIYESYKKDAERLAAIRDVKEHQKFIAGMYEKYLPFFQETWEKAGIDEEAYQQKIRSVFPEELQETIKFSRFLNFSMHIKKTPADNEAPVPPAPPAPAPENICIDPATLWFRVDRVEKNGLANASTDVRPDYVQAWAVGEWAGFGNATAGLASNITIPGTFPDDDKFLRVTKNFQWTGFATAFTGLGCSFATMHYSTVANEESIRLWAPVTWLSTISKNETKTEEYIILKKFMYNIRFGVSTYADSYGGFAALGTAQSACENITWNICEE